MGFTYVRLLTLSQRNSAGNSFAPRAPDFNVLEVEPAGRKLPHPALGRRTGRRELRMRRRTGRRRPDLGLAGDRHRDLPVVDPHRQVRHQRTFDVPHHLLGRQLRRRQHVDLLDRPAVALDDLGRDHSR